MQRKIKKIVPTLAIILSFFLVAPALAQASDAGDNGGGTSSSTLKDPCEGIASAASPTCASCHPKSGSLPALCACHPEYYFGQALSDSELASCQVCNKPGLSYDARTRSCLTHNVIIRYINLFINALAAIATIVIIGVLIFGGIRYSMAGKPDAAAAARKTIINGIGTLVGFWFIWALAQWLIPGGL